MNPTCSRRRLLAAAAALGLYAGRSARAQDRPREGVGSAARVAWRNIALLDGSTLAARDLAGRPVIVQIWASWCPFCAKQNPHLQRLYETTRGTGLQVLTFSIDQRREDAIRYLKSHGYTFPAAMATTQLETWFGRRRGLPELYVVDAGGRVVQHESGEMFPEDIAALARYARGAAS